MPVPLSTLSLAYSWQRQYRHALHAGASLASLVSVVFMAAGWMRVHTGSGASAASGHSCETRRFVLSDRPPSLPSSSSCAQVSPLLARMRRGCLPAHVCASRPVHCERRVADARRRDAHVFGVAFEAALPSVEERVDSAVIVSFSFRRERSVKIHLLQFGEAECRLRNQTVVASFLKAARCVECSLPN